MFFGVAALIGVIIPRIMIMRLAASAVWLEIDYQKSLADPFASSTTCGFFANFPEYFKLDKWLPSVFQPTGVCGDASWNFAGLTMVQWIIIIFVCNAVVAGIVTLLSLVPFDKYKSWVITARHG